MQDRISGPDFDLNLAHRELQIIKNDLHCNAVRICGRDVGRLVATAEDALGQGLEVWLSPELWDHTPTDTLDYLADAAAACEPLRQQWPDRVVLSVGSELTLFMQGILPGKDVLDRIGNPLRLAATMLRLKVLGTHNKPFIGRIRRGTRPIRELSEASSPGCDRVRAFDRLRRPSRLVLGESCGFPASLDLVYRQFERDNPTSSTTRSGYLPTHRSPSWMRPSWGPASRSTHWVAVENRTRCQA